MNATMMALCLAGTMMAGQEPETVFKAPGIEVKTDTRHGKSFSFVLYNRVYLGRQYHKSNEMPDLERTPTTYFHDKSPIGVVLRDAEWFPDTKSPPVMVLGMDIGTLAAYAKKGQTFHFTERVPTFVKLSLPDNGEKRHFTYVQDAMDRGANVKIFEGEPRDMLQKHGAEKSYKVIVVETYKLPVIDVHKELLTKEALELLMSKLHEDGIIAFHTSNRYYQLPPIIAAAAKELNLHHIVGNDRGYYDDPKSDFRFSSEWVMVARHEKILAHLVKNKDTKIDWHEAKAVNLVRGKLIETKVGKEFLWTDKGEQRFHGLYRSDPQIDKLHDSLYDIENYFGGRTMEYMRPLHGLIRAWSAVSADALNRKGPTSANKEKEPPKKIEKN